MGYQGNNCQGFKPQNSAIKDPPTGFNKNQAQKEPLKCWECGGTHYFKYCPVRKNNFNVHSIHEAITVGDMARSMSRICAVMENQQADH